VMEIQRQELTIEFVKLEETRQMIKSRHTSAFLSCTAFDMHTGPIGVS
jgi:hypothetical protein